MRFQPIALKTVKMLDSLQLKREWQTPLKCFREWLVLVTNKGMRHKSSTVYHIVETREQRTMTNASKRSQDAKIETNAQRRHNNVVMTLLEEIPSSGLVHALKAL